MTLTNSFDILAIAMLMRILQAHFWAAYVNLTST